MATAAATIFVGGDRLLPYRIHLEQRSDWHHRFEVTISTEKAKVMGVDLKASESHVIDNAMGYAGAAIEITVEREKVGSLTFKGFVTDVQVDETYAGDAFVILKGFSPTYLLEGHRSVDTFEEQSLKDISNKILQDLPSNVKKAVKPKYTGTIPYVVRYKETQYQFLSRLAATYGEWFYYDGQQLVFGDLPSGSPEVKLTFGSDSMLSFNYGVNVRPSAFKQQFYKYEDNGAVEHSVGGFKPGWLDPHSKQALKASEELFKEEGLDPVAHHIGDSNHIKSIAEAKKSSILSNVMIFSGQSADPGIVVGAEVEVSSRKGFIGKYRVISVVHRFDSNRDYYNIFKAIPATSLVPPVNHGVVMPEAEPQVGEVTDNNDPEKLGRVRVKFKWAGGTTPWIRVLTNYAGPGASEGVTGTYFIPEIGDEVFVEFEHNNPARPYVVGSLYHGGTGPDFADPSDNLKAIKTRSGHKLVFDDTEGKESILITDKKGNKLSIETFNDHITINAGDSIAITAGKSISLTAANSISMAAGTITMAAGTTVNVSAGSSYNLVTTNKLENVAANSMLRTKTLNNFVSDSFNSTAKTINQTAKDSINSKAKENITVSAKKKLEQRSGKMDLVTQTGKLRLKSKSTAEIKGKQVKNN